MNFATVAGLAKGFSDKTKELTQERNDAYKSFKFAISFLFFSTLISAGYLVYKIISKNPVNVEEISLALLVIIPSIIFTKFAAGRHNNLFILREQ